MYSSRGHFSLHHEVLSDASFYTTLKCCFYSPQWAGRFSLNRLASCQTLAEVTAICNGNHENMPHNFGIGKYLNVIYELWERFCRKLSKKCLSVVRISSGVGVWPYWNSSENFTLLKHVGLFSEAGHFTSCIYAYVQQVSVVGWILLFQAACNYDYSRWKNCNIVMDTWF